MNAKPTTSPEEARKVYPGAAIDAADDNKTCECIERQEVRILNDNPRSDEGPKND